MTSLSKKFKKCFLILLIIFPFKTTIFAETDGFDIARIYTQITTHPEIDLYPAISPDGQWIAFASKRSGNMDIWIKPAAGGSAVQITTHRTDDIMPSWSPDGKTLVFVSYRDDALGDLWFVSVSKGRYGYSVKGKPFKITNYLGLDITPVFSPEGQYVAFTSDRAGEKNIYLYKLRNNQIYQITKNGGINPTWSFDKGKRLGFVSFNEQTSNGQIFFAEIDYSQPDPELINIFPVTSGQTNDAFPFWNPLKDEIFFARYDEDSNKDGQINPDDKPGLWKVVLTAEETQKDYQQLINNKLDSQASFSFQEIQLIPKLKYDFYPVCSRDSLVYFVSTRSGNNDIWAVRAEGPISQKQSAVFQYQFASTYFPLYSTDLVYNKLISSHYNFERLKYRLIAFNRVIDFFPTENLWNGWALYEIANTFAALGDYQLARTYYQEILAQYIGFYELLETTKLRLIEIDETGRDGFQDKISYLKQIVADASGLEKNHAAAQLFVGELYYLQHRYSLALKELETLVNDYPSQKDRCATAQLLIGDIYSKFGQTQDIINAYLQVIQKYPQQELWVNLALDRIIALSSNKDALETISEYRNIISRYDEYRRLAARAQLRLGDLFFTQKDIDASINEYKLVLKNYADQKEESAQAELSLARNYLEKEDELRAFQHYKNIIENFASVQGGKYVVDAKERLVEVYIRSGNNLAADGELNAANSRFRSAIEISPRNINAHRGKISTMYMLGRIDEAIQWYENFLHTYPDDEILLYMLGLTYSYKATEKRDRTKNIRDLDLKTMKISNTYIERALSKNYRIVQGYLTLSYNYETIEKYEQLMRSQKKNLFSSLMASVVAPVRSLFYWITFQKEKKPGQWYELAIEALITAITLNDENVNPLLESELALNLASNYYNMGEFGYERAYYYYHVKLENDSTFTNIRAKAEVYRKMGHCAFVAEDFKKGPIYLKKAMQLAKDIGDDINWIVNLKRLALLYQSAGEYDESVECFKQAAAYDKRKKNYQALEIDYRSIAYNYQLLNDEEEAIKYGGLALSLIKSGKIKTLKPKANWIKIGIMGIEFPVWNLGQLGAGASTAAAGFTTDEERALIYSIIGQSNLGQKSVKEAMFYLEKKLKIYRDKKDRVAEAIFLNNIGYLYFLDFDYGKAWEYYKKSYKICNKEDNFPGKIINILNIGNLGILINKLSLLPQNSSDHKRSELIKKRLDYLNQSRNYLQKGAKLFQDQVGFAREKAQLYTLLGSQHFLENFSLPDSVKNNQYELIKHQIDLFDNLAVSDSCYQIALGISQKHDFYQDEISVLQSIGNLSYFLGDLNDALNKFFRARRIAIVHNVFSSIWQTDFMIGKIFTNYKDYPEVGRASRSAGYYLDEAISTLEQSTYNLETFRVSPFYQNQVRMLYQAAIDYSISIGSNLTALRLTEQYRGKQFLDIIGSHKLELKKERHKLFLGNARFLKNEIASLDKKIKIAKEQDLQENLDLPLWINQKNNYETEYVELLEDLNSEDPELESFIVSEPITFSHIQKILYDESIVIDYFLCEEQLYIWTITTDKIDLFQIPIDNRQVESDIRTFISDLTNNSSFDKSGKIVWDQLIGPVAEKIDSFKTIIIIPDGALNTLPFSFLLNFIMNKEEVKQGNNVVVVPGLSNYYYSFQRRKIKRSKLLLASSKLKPDIFDLGYDGENLIKQDKFGKIPKERFQSLLMDADLAFFDVNFEPNENDPLISLVSPEGFKQSEMKIKDLYKMDLQASLLIINGVEKDETLSNKMFQKALLYAGSPSLIFGDLQNKDSIFWEFFFDALLDYPVAQAVTKAQRKMFDQGMSPASYAFYQLIGFEGMNEKQENIFAQERFESKVALGNQYYEDKDWRYAVKNYEHAMVMAKKQGASQAVENLYQLIIECAANGSLWDKAIEYQLEIVETAKSNNDVQTVAEGYKYLVYFYSQNKNYDQALFYQNEYLKLAQDYNLPEEIAGSYRRLGLVYEQDGEIEKSIASFTKAIGYYRELGDSLLVADCLKDRGRIYLLKLDNYSWAIKDQEQALNIFKKFNSTEKSLEVSQNLGLSHELLANYQTALKYQQDAFDLATQLGREQWIALSKQYLANVCWKMGNFSLALNYQKQALVAFKKMNNQKFQSVGLSTQGLILMSLGHVEEAKKLEQQALEIAEEINDLSDMATIHKNISAMYRAQKLWDKAEDHIEQAKQIDEQIGSKRGLGYDHRDLGIIKFQKGHAGEAFEHFRKGLTISQEILDARNMVQCLFQIGNTHFLMNDFNSALDTLELATNKAEELYIPDVEWRALRMLGKVYWEKNNFQKSLEYFNKALTIIESMRSELKVEEYKSGFMDNKLEVYYDLVNLYLKLNQPGKALEIVERAKSRNFIDLLANRDINFGGNYDRDNFEKAKNINEEIRQIQNEITQILVKGSEATVTENKKLENLKSQSVELKNSYQNLLIQLKEQNPELANMVAVEPMKVDSLQTIIPDSTVLLEYFYTEDQIIIWAVKNNFIMSKQVKIGADELFLMVDSLRKEIEKQISTDKISNELYDILIAPMESSLSGINHIVIIPHGILHYLPFACLKNGNKKYLIDNYSISLSPSAMVLNYCVDKGDYYLKEKSWNRKILAFGNPDLGDQQFDLPFAELEIESIQLLYPNVISFMNKKATEGKLKESIGESNLIAFSCHGEFDPVNPLFSALLLAADSENDGRLEAHEIFELDINAYLVAMSACETGLAKIGVGDEVVGLSRSFIYAGTASLLSSLWKVDDLATAVLVKRFFRNIKAGFSRSKALQRAQIFVRDHINVHPVYWSAFNITGDFR